MELEDIIYFDKSHPMLNVIKNYIITQCSSVCREEIYPETVSKEFSEFDFGYVRKTLKAVTGIRNLRKNHKEIVHSFVLCKYKSDKSGKKISINIQLLCNSKNNSVNNKDGDNLLKVVETKAMNEKIKNLTLYSLGKIGLKRWYVKQGFVVDGEVKLKDTNTIKVYIMSKEL